MPALGRRRRRLVQSTRRATIPAFSSTFRCWEIAGCVISKGLASSITVASPLARRARIARRVGSAKAEKKGSRFSVFDISNTLYKVYLIVKEKPAQTCASTAISSDFQRHAACFHWFQTAGGRREGNSNSRHSFVAAPKRPLVRELHGTPHHTSANRRIRDPRP